MAAWAKEEIELEGGAKVAVRAVRAFGIICA